MYSLLTPIRYVLNPRFGLTSPLQSGLFYIAPGAGYLIGTFFGGRWSDRFVKKYIKIRGGERVPEDRLRSCLPAMGLVIPACMVIYGWSIEKKVGGIPLPVIAMVLQGIAQLFTFPSLNSYCLDVMQSRSSEVVGLNYFVRYLFGVSLRHPHFTHCCLLTWRTGSWQCAGVAHSRCHRGRVVQHHLGGICSFWSTRDIRCCYMGQAVERRN